MMPDWMTVWLTDWLRHDTLWPQGASSCTPHCRGLQRATLQAPSRDSAGDSVRHVPPRRAGRTRALRALLLRSAGARQLRLGCADPSCVSVLGNRHLAKPRQWLTNNSTHSRRPAHTLIPQPNIVSIFDILKCCWLILGVCLSVYCITFKYLLLYLCFRSKN